MNTLYNKVTVNNNENDPRTLTVLLERARSGDQNSEHRFCEFVYDELYEIALRLVRGRPNVSIEPALLVNELFMQFFQKGTLPNAHNRKYFFAVAIDQMRKLLIAHYRTKTSKKKGGNFISVPLDEALSRISDEFQRTHQFDFEALEIALQRLKLRHPRQYEVIIYRFYGGLSVAETAKALNISVGSVRRDWRLGRARLYAELKDSDD